MCALINKKKRFLVLANQPTVHSGKLSGEGSVAVAVAVINRWQVTYCMWRLSPEPWHLTADTWHVKHNKFKKEKFLFFWHLWYYQQTLGDSVSPICRSFSIKKLQDLKTLVPSQNIQETFSNLTWKLVARLICDGCPNRKPFVKEVGIT